MTLSEMTQKWRDDPSSRDELKPLLTAAVKSLAEELAEKDMQSTEDVSEAVGAFASLPWRFRPDWTKSFVGKFLKLNNTTELMRVSAAFSMRPEFQEAFGEIQEKEASIRRGDPVTE